MSTRFWLRVAIVLGVGSWLVLAAHAATSAPRPLATTDLGTAIVAVHGGGWYGGTPAKMNAVCADLASFGDCFQPTYTLSGVASFRDANADLRDFVLGLRTEGYTRIIGIGASAGGNLVAWLAAHDYLDAAVTLSAPTKLTTLADWYRDQCSCWAIAQFAPSSQKKINASPALDTVTVPILIIHSEDETTIPQLQAYKLAEVSTQPTLEILPGSAHAMAYWSAVSNDVTTWMEALA